MPRRTHTTVPHAVPSRPRCGRDETGPRRIWHDLPMTSAALRVEAALCAASAMMRSMRVMHMPMMRMMQRQPGL